MVLFNQFQLLDVFGPLEMFGVMKEEFDIRLVSEHAGVVASSAGPRSISDHSFSDLEHYDILMVPGGMGTRKEVENKKTLSWIKARALSAEYIIPIAHSNYAIALAISTPALRWNSSQ